MKPIKEGKVREIYDNGDSLIMVATDRISCFDVILKNDVTKKGTVLTQMSRFWFDMTKDILPNHMISTDVADMPEFFRQPQFDGNSMMCRKLNMLPIECIVRGYITGSGWASYQKDGTVCGIALPEGLQESDQLPEPIYTPSTKAEIGDHDENISYEQSIAHLENISRARARNTRPSSAIIPSRSIRNVRITQEAAASSLRIPNSSSAWMRTAISSSAMRCSHPTAPVSGQLTSTSRGTASPPSTNSLPVTGSRQTRAMTGRCRRIS